MTVGFSRTTALVAMALLASACNMTPGTNTPPASNQAASAQPGAGPASASANPDRYQITLIRGSANASQVALRVDSVTGKSDLSLGGAPLIPITDTQPVPMGNYGIYSWSTLDSGATTREWNAYRFDRQSGRIWNLVYDGVVTASWTEIVAAPPPSPAAPAPAPAAPMPAAPAPAAQ
jgi:hypothetical protein